MVYVPSDEEPAMPPPGCVPRCAPLHRRPQTKWSRTLCWQMALYMSAIVLSMALGGAMPSFIAKAKADAAARAAAAAKSVADYAYCAAMPAANYTAPGRGAPPPPLAIDSNGALIDATTRRRVTLRGVSWFGFDNDGGMVDALWVGGRRADTDFHALTHQIRLLGFNTVRLPFTFAQLARPGRGQVMECKADNKAAWAARATDPKTEPPPAFFSAPDPSVTVPLEAWEAELCNTYIPSNATALSGERLLWTAQYLVAAGFYVVLDYHPTPADPLPRDPAAFARAWLRLWANATCLPHFAVDLRGRLLLDLLNQPDAALDGKGARWARTAAGPGLDELYLTAMDALDALAPGDALFMLQGSGRGGVAANAKPAAGFGLSAGDGFVTDPDIIREHGLSDPRPFFTELVARPYANRTLLAPHAYPPSVPPALQGAPRPPAGGAELFDKLAASWGKLARDGFCVAPAAGAAGAAASKPRCRKFPVVIGEMGGKLEPSSGDAAFFRDLAKFAAADGALAKRTAPVAGWVWWSFNPNSATTGGLVAPGGRDGYVWPKVRLLADGFGLRPWYQDPQGFAAAAEAGALEAERLRAEAEAAARAAEARRKKQGGSGSSGGAKYFRDIAEIVVPYKPKSSGGGSGSGGSSGGSGSSGKAAAPSKQP